MPIRLQKIDNLTLPDHCYLDQRDECYYLFEYTPRQQGSYDSVSNFIFNLKKPVDRKGRPEYRYKERAISQAGDYLRLVLNEEWISSAMLVPIPCSKTKQNPLYDDRILRILGRMTRGLTCDVRELIVQTADLESFHGGCRMRPAQLRQYYALDRALCECDQPPEVTVFDDLLTTGSHFKAVQSVIHDHWPDVHVSGIFIARRFIPHDGDDD